MYVSSGFFFPRRSPKPPSSVIPLATLTGLLCLPLVMLVTSGSAITTTLVPEPFLRSLTALAPLGLGALSAESEEGGKEEELECLREGREEAGGEEYIEGWLIAAKLREARDEGPGPASDGLGAAADWEGELEDEGAGDGC